MSRERELLERALADYDQGLSHQSYFEEIRAYLAEPEVKREKLTQEEIVGLFEWEPDAYECEWHWFIKGVRFAEKHHGIGLTEFPGPFEGSDPRDDKVFD